MNNEPAAWGMENDDGQIYDCITPEEHAREEGAYTVALYRKREWVELTPIEKARIWDLPHEQWIQATAKLLMEKNA